MSSVSQNHDLLGQSDEDADSPPGPLAAASSGAAASSSSATGHLVINWTLDSSFTTLQTQNSQGYTDYVNAIQKAVQFYEDEISDPITINITFGWGEDDNMPIPGYGIGSSERVGTNYTYAQLYTGISAADTTSAVQTAAFALLPATDPTGGGNFFIGDAEAKVLGLGSVSPTGTETDGYVGLNSLDNYIGFPQVPNEPGPYDPVGTLEHEISEVMGRVDYFDGKIPNGTPDKYSLLDFYHYTAANPAQTSPGSPAGALDEPFVPGFTSQALSYFSYNGQTITLPYDSPTEVENKEDVADWDNSIISGDSYGGGQANVDELISVPDLEEMNVLGFDVPAVNVTIAYQAILRTTATVTTANQIGLQITTGQTTLAQYESGLIAQAQQTTVPALIVYDAFYGGTENGGGLSYVTNSDAAPLVNIFTQSANPNVEEAVYSTLGSWFSIGSNNFASLYGGLDRTTYIDDVYQSVFGTLPASGALTYLLGSLNGYVNEVTAAGIPNAELLGRGAVYGDLLFDAETSQTGTYFAPANAFLQAAANGTVTYGPELTQEFPSNTASQLGTDSLSAADPNVISAAGPDQLVDPGTGSYTIQFLSGASGNTLVLHPGGVDQVYGFDPGTDVLDLRSVLARSNIGLSGEAAFLGGTVGIEAQGSDVVVTFDPTALGNGATIAVIHGIVPGTTRLEALIAQNGAPVQLGVVSQSG